MPVRPEEKIRCSFCGKNQDQVRKMIAGSNGVYICDECIELNSKEFVKPRNHCFFAAFPFAAFLLK